MSPELLDPEQFGLKDSCLTKESDCYALGMVVYEVLTGGAPFAGCKSTVVIRRVMDGKRPERPHGTPAGSRFTDDLWGMLERCWEHQPHDRPSLKTLLLCLEGATQASRSPSPITATNWDAVTDANNSLDPTVNNPGMVSTSFTASNVKQPESGYLESDKPPLPHFDLMVIPSTEPPPSTPSKPSLVQPNSPQIPQ